MRRLLLSFAVCVTVLLAGSATRASVVVGDRITFGNGPGSRAGIFYIDNLSNGVGDDFSTFCVELEEYINFSSTYGVEKISSATEQTGRSLGSFSAWLYTEYLDGNLTGFLPDAFNADTLQLGIWQGMDYTEAYLRNRLGNSFYDTHDNQKLSGWKDEFDADVQSGNWSGTGDIYIMNLREVVNGDYRAYAQDQLIRIPEVPEPSAILVWSLMCAVAGCVMWRTRSRNANR